MCEQLRTLGNALGALWLSIASAASAVESPGDLAHLYRRDVDQRLEVPAGEQRFYAEMLEAALRDARLTPSTSQYVLLVDRNANVEAIMLFWRSSTGTVIFIGASPTSTGRPGGFEHFETPTGVFAHTLANLDFRAEGTENEFGVCGYGSKGMRVYDFGWIPARRTWDTEGESPMRLQMHSTDPRLFEPRLGTAQSKGCIRIPASLNEFIDRYGILDFDYEQAMASGQSFWVLHPERTPTPWSGRYLIIVDSERAARPGWSPAPARR